MSKINFNNYINHKGEESMRKFYLRKISSLILTLGIVVSSAGVTKADSNISVTRYQGANRYDTSVKVSQAAYNQSDYVILANGKKFADALSGGQLSVALKAPILLVDSNNITSSVIYEIQRLGAKKAFILGGNSSISSQVETYCRNTLDLNTERLAGYNRYKTSMAILNRTSDFGNYNNIVVVDGKNYPDALAATSYMMKKNALMLLSDGKTLPKITGYNVEAVGGYSGLPLSDYNIPRIAGNNRYDTSAVLAQKAFKNSKNAIIASGCNFPDALTAVSLSVAFNAPILLTSNNSLSSSVKSYLQYNTSSVKIVGGNISISTSISYSISSIVIGESEEQPTPDPNPTPDPSPTPNPQPTPSPFPTIDQPDMSDCEPDDDSKFYFDKERQEITGYKGYKRKLIIPSRIDGTPVKGLNMSGAYREVRTEAIVISEGIEYIAGSCFSGDKIERVKLPSTLKRIGKDSFNDNRIQNLVIPNGVKEIGSGAFSENYIEYVSIPPSVLTIGSYAFYNNYIKSVQFNQGIKNIEDDAFKNNHINTDIYIPTSIDNMHRSAFFDNELIGKVYCPRKIIEKIKNDVFGVPDNFVAYD